jgi:hypothetical protein
MPFKFFESVNIKLFCIERKRIGIVYILMIIPTSSKHVQQKVGDITETGK